MTVEELGTVLAEDGEADVGCSLQENPPPNGFGLIWGQGIPDVAPLVYLPPAAQIPFYLDKYAQRVDPHIKILHLPTESASFLAYGDVSARTSKAPTPLIFAMCYSATASLSDEECKRELGEDKRTLLLKYKLATQYSLQKASLLRTKDISVLQAFLLFLCSLPGTESEELWPMSGLALRVAQQMGLHRDGSHFALSPFTVEMRRRLWWQICFFDLMASERCGVECTTLDMAFDTHPPLNVRDNDLSPNMQNLPEVSLEYTEITCSLIRFEMVRLLRRLKPVAVIAGGLVHKERCVADFAENIFNTYLHPRNSEHPLFLIGTAVFRFLLSKIWLLLYRPFRSLRHGLELPHEIVDRLFTSSLECLESGQAIMTDPRVSQRSVLFRSPRQWHQLCYVLLQLLDGRDDDFARRAWETITELSLPPLDSSPDSKTSLLLRPLHELMAPAREIRMGAATVGENHARDAHELSPGRVSELVSCTGGNETSSERQNAFVMPEFSVDDSTLPWSEWQAVWDEFDTGVIWEDA
ncbi:hypothetical protein SLS56_011833 [Neofusicoccum ribis]|uniref:Xylanolytic transcriptional activator regulatory domain-containing protein n=1 Tax=Neofusicoccum ribis TaxID=45134 RepID=A0ABR3SAH8_9PEZI